MGGRAMLHKWSKVLSVLNDFVVFLSNCAEVVDSSRPPLVTKWRDPPMVLLANVWVDRGRGKEVDIHPAELHTTEFGAADTVRHFLTMEIPSEKWAVRWFRSLHSMLLYKICEIKSGTREKRWAQETRWTWDLWGCCRNMAYGSQQTFFISGKSTL